MKKIKTFDVAFDAVTKQEAAARIFAGYSEGRQKYGVTPNPEMLLCALKNPEFRDALNSAFLSVPDGIGILWASAFLEMTKRNRSKFAIIAKAFFSLFSLIVIPRYCAKVFPERVSGVDLFLEIVRQSVFAKLKIFLLGAQDGVAEKVKRKLEDTFPDALIVGTYAGSPRPADFPEIQKRIRSSEPDLLFVAYGAPLQELWISQHLKNLPSVRFAMGVGGTFDFIAGAKKRAPKWMQKIGIEWLYRVLQEPSRWKRIWNATIKFPWKVVRSRLKN